jgi:hypothetical protein
LFIRNTLDTGTYSSAKLQDRLVKHYGGSIVIHTQRGQGISNLVFSDKLSLGDAIASAGKYKSKCKAYELEIDFQVDVEGISDEQILHSAVGQGTALFVRISRYRSAKMLLVHADGMSLRMVVTWLGLLLFLLQVEL